MTAPRVCVLPGDALVARSGDGVLVVDLHDPAHDDVRRELLDGVAEVCGAGTPPTGALARRLIMSIVAVPRESVPAFGVAARSSGGVDVLLVGDVAAAWTDERGDHRVSGRQGTNWVDLLVPAGVEKLVIGREGVSGEGHQLADLRDGAVVGGGAVIELSPSPPAAAGRRRSSAGREPGPDRAPAGRAPADEPAPEAAPEPEPPAQVPADGREAEPEPTAQAPAAAAPAAEASVDTGGGPAIAVPPPGVSRPAPEPAPFVSVHLGDDDEEPEAREPLPVAGQAGAEPEPAAPVGVATGPALVPGIRCAVGHFNHPDSRYCVACGRGFDQGVSRIVTTGPRPPLGVLVIDDGAAFVLDADYVVGREPEFDPAVPAGAARPLTLTDANRTVSRVHAEVRLDGWDVVLVDRGSTNGTYVLPPGAAQWSRVPPAGRAVVPPGGRVAFGQRTLVYESHHVVGR